MEVFQPFGAAMVIMQESIQILPKNGKLVALTVSPTLFLSSLFFLVFNISSKSLFHDMLMRESFLPFTGSETAEFSSAISRLKQDLGLVFLIDLAFILASWIISLFSITASILLSSISKTDRDLSSKVFAILVVKTCIRPVITAIYTSLLGFGYFFFVLAMSGPVFMFSHFGMGQVPSSIIWYGICAYISYLYLSIPWILSLVVSVVEENCYGVEALGKAGRIIKGKRAEGFILSVIFFVFSLLAFQGFRIVFGHRWLVNSTAFWLVVLNFWTLVKLFMFVAYTVLYFHCKKHHGEEIELEGGAADFYDKIISAPFLDDDDDDDDIDMP